MRKEAKATKSHLPKDEAKALAKLGKVKRPKVQSTSLPFSLHCRQWVVAWSWTRRQRRGRASSTSSSPKSRPRSRPRLALEGRRRRPRRRPPQLPSNLLSFPNCCYPLSLLKRCQRKSPSRAPHDITYIWRIANLDHALKLCPDCHAGAANNNWGLYCLVVKPIKRRALGPREGAAGASCRGRPGPNRPHPGCLASSTLHKLL